MGHQTVVRASTLFGGPPTPPLSTAYEAHVDIEVALAALPRPRKHYWWYSASAASNKRHAARAAGTAYMLLAMYFVRKSTPPG